ncbi:YSIRK-type signal peptide-containing protein, partial [Lactobacillus intestinalis]|uniref:YSIRK-type signal peptide-containing protein n=1 Tax=Lactobacillus intestinalis TaxID=151781 RepID=UPI002430E6F1
MVSKNNRKMENVAERQSHFGIRKLTIGAASVLLGTTLWMSNGNVVQASDNGNDGNNGDHAADDSKTETPKITDDTKVVIEKSDDAAQAAQSQNQTNDNAQSQEAQADQNKVESSAVEKAQTESAQADTSVQQTQQNTEKSAKSDKDQTTKDQVAENAKEALEVQKQKAETVTNSNSKTSTETINKEASAESAKQSSAQEATKAAENAESNVTKAIDNSNATLATTNEVAVAGQTLKTAGIQGNTNQKDAKSNDNTVNVDLSKLGVTGTTDKGIQKTSFAVKRLLSANTQNLESNEVNVQQFSPQALASLFTTSLVQTSGSGSNDATDIDTYTPNFNITENPEYQQYFAAIPADQYAFQSYEVVSTGQKIVVTTDKNDIGNNIRFYNVRNGSAQLVYQMTRDTQTNANGTVVREEASQQGTFTTAGVASNSTYKGGTYNWSLNQTNSVNFAGIGNLKIGRIDITAGNSNSPVDNGTGAFVTDDAHRITITWDQGRPISDSIIPGKTWNSAGSNIPDKVTQKIWYVDAETGKVLSYKTSAKAFNGSSYDSTSNELKTITKDGKTYQLVARGSDGLYSSSDFSDILNKQLTTNNGVPITVGDLLSTPLKGILGDGRIGNIRASITNYQGTRSYTRLQTKTDGTIDLNTYL